MKRETGVWALVVTQAALQAAGALLAALLAAERQPMEVPIFVGVVLIASLFILSGVMWVLYGVNWRDWT